MEDLLAEFVQENDITSLRKLLENGIPPTFKSLTSACVLGRVECLKLLIDRKCNVNYGTHKYGITPLMYASRNNQYICVKMIIRDGAKLDTKDTHRDWTALDWAVYCNKKESALLLLDERASINIPNNVIIPPWFKEALSKRRNIKRSLIVFMCLGRNVLKHDMTRIIAWMIWETRNQDEWEF